MSLGLILLAFEDYGHVGTHLSHDLGVPRQFGLNESHLKNTFIKILHIFGVLHNFSKLIL